MKRRMMVMCLVVMFNSVGIMNPCIAVGESTHVNTPQVKRLDLMFDEIRVGPKGDKVQLIKNEGLANKGVEIMQRIINHPPGKLSRLVRTWWFGVIEGDGAYGQDVGEIEGYGNSGCVVAGETLLKRYSCDQIAFVIAHEIADCILQHRTPRIEDLPWCSERIIIPRLYERKLSREQEKAADDLAITFMQSASFNPKRAGEYFEGEIEIKGPLADLTIRVLSFVVTHAAPAERLAIVKNRIGNPIIFAKPQITYSLQIPETPPYKVGQVITAKFTIKNEGSACITFDVLTVGGGLNAECPDNKCPDFEWKTNVNLPPNAAFDYQGKLNLEALGNYHFFTAYTAKDGKSNTAVPTAPGVTNTKDIFVEPIEWRDYKLGTLVFSVPSDWKVVIGEEDSFVAGSTEDYRDRRYVSFMVGVANLGDAFKDVEQGKTRIIHYGSNGGEVKERGNPPTITIGHMGRLVDSFKAEIANRPVTICVLHVTEKEGMVVEGVKFTNWSFALIDGGKHYAFSLTSVDPAFQSAMFSQLVSKIHLLSQPSKKPVAKFLIPVKEGTYEKAQGFKGTVYKGLFHLGRDYCVKKAGVNKNGSLSGTTVYPIAGGTVVGLRFNKYPAKDSEKWKKGDGVGNYVSIEHGNGIVAVYMHLAKVEVSRGQKVTAQTPLGEAGDIILHPEDPGKMCPHLHLEIRKNGVTSLHVPPNLRYGYISQDGTTKIEEGKRIENVLGWIDLNFYDPDSILATRKTSPASAMRILFIGQEQKDSAFALFALNSDGSELTKILSDFL